MIDIIIVDIPEAYGVILSRDWSSKLNGYFTINWYHIRLPCKGRANKIKVDHECYMKHTITDLNDLNEMVMFSNSIPENICFDTFFGELEVELSPFVNSNEQSKLFHTTQISKPIYNIVEYSTNFVSNNFTNFVSSSINFSLELIDPNIWTLYFDGSENKEGSGVGFLLIDPHGNRMTITCLPEFEHTNNVVEYEALVKGPRKSLDLHVKCIEVFGDSQIVTQHVRNLINYTSNHLNNYQ